MSRSHHSTVRPKNLEQNLNRFDVDASNSEPTSTSQNKTTPPILRNVVENNREIIDPIAYDTNQIHFFKQLPKEVIRKILLEHVIDLNHFRVTAKNLMKFANVSKFNREFVREMLIEKKMHQVSCEITKSVMPDY